MKPSREELLTDKVKHVDFDRINTVADLLEAWQDSSIQSRALATAAQVWKDAVEDDERPTIMLGLSGALIAGGSGTTKNPFERYKKNIAALEAKIQKLDADSKIREQLEKKLE